MRILNVLVTILVFIVGVTFAVTPALQCNRNICRSNCIANGATGGICQVERNGDLKCICSYNPPPLCDTNTCTNYCVATGANSGLCQVERNGALKCICVYS